jgi:small subunit ribosomal protein S6
MVTEGKLKDYELMVIFSPVLSEDDYKKQQQKYIDLVLELGGNIVHKEVWGLRTLAYPIEKKTSGLYFVLEYQAPTDANAKIEIQLNRDEHLLRQMITSLDKDAVAYNLRKRNKHLAAESETQN